MIPLISGGSPVTSQSDGTPPVMTLDSQLSAGDAPVEHTEDIDGLYSMLKKMWESNPDFDSADVINYLGNYKNADGVMPYRSTQTHVSAIAQVMERLKKEGGEELAIYSTLNKSLGYAVASNGILVSFISKMLIRGEQPESW